MYTARYLYPCSVGGTGFGTFQITSSSIAPSAVMSLKRVINCAGMLAILPTRQCVLSNSPTSKNRICVPAYGHSLLLCWCSLRCSPALGLFFLLSWRSLRCAPAFVLSLLLCWCSLRCAPAFVLSLLLCWRSLRCAPAVGQGPTKWAYVLRPRVAGVCSWCASTLARTPLSAHRLCTAANPGLRPHTHFASPKIFL